MTVPRILTAALLFGSPLSGQWTVHTRTDAMTDELRKEALTTNDYGMRLSLYRIRPSGAVYLNFSLPDTVLDVLHHDISPMFRVDKNDPWGGERLSNRRELESILGRVTGAPSIEIEPKWVNTRIWHGKLEEGIAVHLFQLATGSELVVRYYLFTGGYKEASFSLAESGLAIADALDLPPDLDWEHSYRSGQVQARETARCADLRGRSQQRCFDTVTRCTESSAGDTTLLLQCIRSARDRR